MNLDRPIAEIFTEEGYVARDQLEGLLAKRNNASEAVGDLLVRLGVVTEAQKLKCYALQSGLPFIDLARTEIPPHVVSTLPQAIAVRHQAVPVEITETAASVAMSNPLDLGAIDEISDCLGVDVDPMWAMPDAIRDALRKTFGVVDDFEEVVRAVAKDFDVESLQVEGGEDDEEAVNVIELREATAEAPVVRLSNGILARAINSGASDVHIEPMADRVRIRLRIDGLLQESMTIPKELHRPLVSRIKITAGLDIAERRMPQDGRCTLVSSHGEYDFRVSTYPTVHGEKVVTRILDKRAVRIDLARLGIPEGILKTLKERATESQGLILVTGPTGSGKTTTLYSILHYLNEIHRNIVSIEDPVEYQLPGIVQANVNPVAGLTFASGLRSILRQDPDVILVGEVRDSETANIAIESSLTGHLVLTSLHANDSAAALTRLIDMGVEPFLVGASITASLAQRLLRTNCKNCQERYQPDTETLEKLELPAEHAYFRGTGCEACNRTGYKGRVGVYELLDVQSDVRKLILKGETGTAIKELAAAKGMQTLREDAASKVLAGLTTVEEVFRVTTEAI